MKSVVCEESFKANMEKIVKNYFLLFPLRNWGNCLQLLFGTLNGNSAIRSLFYRTISFNFIQLFYLFRFHTCTNTVTENEFIAILTVLILDLPSSSHLLFFLDFCFLNDFIWLCLNHWIEMFFFLLRILMGIYTILKKVFANLFWLT